ncbi:MAG: 4Fe-4S dicluster domain-containing protein [Caldimicrobium sp.]|nr:4Fe-4S dicluster domain-containing protein [Caldimicrobium sp.]MDW8183241.1 4Fe-4S dicluster domain-containing protein [Caldimicrobium sp.]
MPAKKYKITPKGLENLFDLLSRNYNIVGPSVEKRLIKFKQVKSLDDIAFGFKSIEGAGFYNLERDNWWFSYNRPANTLKDFLHPGERFLTEIIKEDNEEKTFQVPRSPWQYCFFDIRSCDLQALFIMDKVFKKEPFYLDLRNRSLIIAVNCNHAMENCFCTITKTGPEIRKGFDLLLTEGEDYFLLEVGSKKGQILLDQVSDKRVPSRGELEDKNRRLRMLKGEMADKFNMENIAEKLLSRLNLTYWKEIEERCLSCGNCTSVCPTCFCYDILEKSSLSFAKTQRTIVWDSCFSPDFATINRFNIRGSLSSRYRHWILHKFVYSTLHFKRCSCVGCGRCITFCPAGIDIREEVLKVVSS